MMEHKIIDVRRSSVTEIISAPNIEEVLREYSEESSLQEMGQANPNFQTYLRLEKSGMFAPIAAFDGGQLAGFMLPYAVMMPHYEKLMASAESYFVPKAYRKHGVGLRILWLAEKVMKQIGAKAFGLSFPANSRMVNAMPKLGYRHSNQIFIKALA